MLRALIAFLILTAALHAEEKPPVAPEAIAREIIAPLLDPVKLATLRGDRPANRRLYLALHWLEMARRGGGDPGRVIDQAQTSAGYGGTVAAKADKAAIVWTHGKLARWGCFDAEGMERMKRGAAPMIKAGEHAGEGVELDHVLPVAIVPELKAAVFNLEALPAKVNRAKSADITQRELALARRWRGEGLLSEDGLRAVLAAGVTGEK
jgi:hypothetical protein